MVLIEIGQVIIEKNGRSHVLGDGEGQLAFRNSVANFHAIKRLRDIFAKPHGLGRRAGVTRRLELGHDVFVGHRSRLIGGGIFITGGIVQLNHLNLATSNVSSIRGWYDRSWPT